MKKTISMTTVIIFFLSVYFIPSISAITLGEIKPDKQVEETPKKINEPVKDDSKKKPPLTEEPNKKTVPDKKDKSREKPDEKEEINPRLVCLLSVLMPGGGHFYLNNDMKGISFCLAAGIGYTATGFFMVKTMLADRGSAAYKNYLLLTGFLFFITLVIHFVGIIEAYSDADELNKQKLFGNEDNSPFVTEFVLK